MVHKGDGMTTLGGGTAISGGGTPNTGGGTAFWPVPAEFNHCVCHRMRLCRRFCVYVFLVGVVWLSVPVQSVASRNSSLK